MASKRDIVITGCGVVSPIGIGCEAVRDALCNGRSGVRRLDVFSQSDLPVPFGADVADFEPKKYVRPRKSLKVMSRDIQLGFAAADVACVDAGFRETPVDPERLGIVFGAEMIDCDLSELLAAFRGCLIDGQFDYDLWGEQSMAEMYPLWMLKYLPNMPACHIGIAQDARGPNNSITLGEISSLAAIAEAVRVIERGHADTMIAGGAGSKIHPASWIRGEVFGLSRRSDDPAAAPRPFDAMRDGAVNGEGAGALILETREHAKARGAKILASILGFAGTFEPRRNGQAVQGTAIRHAIAGALRDAGVDAADIGHVNANAGGSQVGDAVESKAIAEMLGDVPVTAPKSYFGDLGAGTGAVELAVSLMAIAEGTVAPTLNYEHPDPECPVNVIHGTPFKCENRMALVLNDAHFGQAMAMVLGEP